MQKSRAAMMAALVAGLVLVLAPLTTPAANAAASVDVLLYSNVRYTDPVEEDAELAGALTEAGGTVVLFDGGDGSVGVWESSLAGVEILVVPEFNFPFLSSLSADVIATLSAWVHGGGQLFVSTTTGLDLVNAITGHGFVGYYAANSSVFPLVTGDPLPAELHEANSTSLIYIEALSEGEQAALTSVYAHDEGATVAVIAHGEGQIVFFGYDWFPDELDITEGHVAVWNEVLAFFVQSAPTSETEPAVDPAVQLAVAPAAAPQLAETGAEQTPLLVGALLLVVAGLGAAVVARGANRSV